jgi:tetratricopeptide (TPR) repeat protein
MKRFFWMANRPSAHSLFAVIGASVLSLSNTLLLAQSGASASGLQGEYYANRDCSGPAVYRRVDGPIDLNFVAQPIPGLPAGGFSVRWAGYLVPSVSSDYQLCGQRNNGLRIWVDGRLVLDQWNNGHGAFESPDTLSLEAGHRYRLHLEYFQDWGPAVLKLMWRRSGQPEVVIPKECLVPPDENFLLTNGAKTEAKTSLEKASELHELGAEALLAAGANRDRRDAAINLLAEASAADPTNAVYAVDLADALSFMGDDAHKAAALDIYENLQRTFPEDDAIRARAVNCLSEMGSYGVAMDRLAARVRQSRPIPDALTVQVSAIGLASHNLPRAAALLRQAKAHAPSDNLIAIHLAILAKALGREQEMKSLTAEVLSREKPTSLFAVQARRLQEEVKP